MFYWKAHSSDFIDIRFQFRATDPNFKFLQFCLLLNNEILTLHLPITLLDMGVIRKHLDYEEISNFI